MSEMSGSNRRKFPRVHYPCLLKLKQGDAILEPMLTHTENIAIGGVCIIMNRELRAMSVVDLELDLMDTDEHLHCQGKVVWVIQRRAQESKKPLFFDVGIEFCNLSQHDRHRLEEIVKRLVKIGEEVQ